MTQLSTFIETPEQVNDLLNISLFHVIIDLPFCSIRPYQSYDWSNDELNDLRSKMNMVGLMINLDGIYTDDELNIIRSTLLDRELLDIFHGFRIQDIGLVKWIQKHFKGKKIHLNPEMGMQNSIGIDHAFQQGVHSFTFNHETPVNVITDVITNRTHQFELFVQGPLLIQYSRRRFLHNLYENTADSSIELTSIDPELPGREFTFLDTPFGHFMMAHFHRSLARYREKFDNLNVISALIDTRGQSNKYRLAAITLYHNLFTLNDDQIDSYLTVLEQESKRPQKPSFFLSNNTDFDWRDEQAIKIPEIGRIVTTKKNESTIIEFFIPCLLTDSIVCINPDRTVAEISIAELVTLHHETVTSISPFESYLILNAPKGVQVKGKLYFKNS